MSTGAEKMVLLAVDDVSMNLKIIKAAMSRYFDVRVAKSGELALFIIGNVKVDIMLLDIEMPGMSGFEVLENMKRNYKDNDIPVICVTSHSDIDIQKKALEAGARDCVSKPFDINVLTGKIFSILGLQPPE